MNNVKKSISKERNLKHVKVYDHLYSMIKDGAFPAGSQLPSEPDLAVQMDVSRMTLRKALSLLREDGLIQNIQGKGNFVIDSFKSLDGIITNKKPTDAWLEFFNHENVSILWK